MQPFMWSTLLHTLICTVVRLGCLLWPERHWNRCLQELLLYLATMSHLSAAIAAETGKQHMTPDQLNHLSLMSQLAVFLWAAFLVWPSSPKLVSGIVVFAVLMAAAARAASPVYLFCTGLMCVIGRTLLPALLLLSPWPQVCLIIDGWRTWRPLWQTYRAGLTSEPPGYTLHNGSPGPVYL